MLPSLNFNPSFANLAALHGMGGMPHPIMPGAPPMQGPTPPMPVAPMPGQMPMGAAPTGVPMPVQPHMGGYGGYGMPPGMPQNPMQGQMGGLDNMQALMQLLRQRGTF